MVKHIALGLLAAWGLSAWAQPNGSTKPVFKVGDVAVYTVNNRADKRIDEETVTVTAVESELIRFSHVRPGREPAEIEGQFTPDMRQVQSGTSGTRFDPPIPLAMIPMVVGDSWKSASEMVALNKARSKTDFTYKVVATEKLTTPAGDFETFKIESDGWVTGISWQGSLRVTQSLWYAPSIGRVVRSEFRDFRGGRPWTDTLTELKTFKPAP
jgi:hypothetical protein